RNQRRSRVQEEDAGWRLRHARRPLRKERRVHGDPVQSLHRGRQGSRDSEVGRLTVSLCAGPFRAGAFCLLLREPRAIENSGMSGLETLLAALTRINLLLALAGVIAGTAIGAIPGLTATMAVAVLVPFTFGMPPAPALILMGAIYTGAIYGGAYSAILLNTPGTPSAIATTLDGYPMARRGDGDLAMTLACLASVVGGLVGALALLTLAPPLSRVALAFGPVEYFWLAIFGLSLISAISEGSLLKGLA